MASLPRSGSSTSLNESPESTTMRECHMALVELLKPAVGSLGDALFARGLIPPDVKDGIQETTSKATAIRDVIGYLQTQIRYDRQVYHKFVDVLREQGPWTNAVVEQLTSCYESQDTIPEPMSVESESSKSQGKLQLEFTVPQDVPRPQELYHSLGSVKFKVLQEDQVSPY